MRPRPTPSEEVTRVRLGISKDTTPKRHHHGGDVCGLVVLGVDSTFSTIPTVGILRALVFSENFIPQNKISTQLIDATSFV